MSASEQSEIKIQIHAYNFMADFSDELLFLIKYKSIV